MPSIPEPKEKISWWQLLRKPSFSNQKTRQEAEAHFGAQGYSTGERFALSSDQMLSS